MEVRGSCECMGTRREPGSAYRGSVAAPGWSWSPICQTDQGKGSVLGKSTEAQQGPVTEGAAEELAGRE